MSLLGPVRSSLGKKYVVAVTGVLLIGFVLFHMVGNLLVFAGPDALNSYAAAFKAKGALLWVARGGLLAIFLVHLFVSLKLQQENRAARGSRYAYESTLRASWASRNMLLTGLVLLAFIIYHLAHFTLGYVKLADVQVAANGTTFDLNPKKNYLNLVEVKPTGGKTYMPDVSKNHEDLYDKQLEARHDVYSMVISGFRNPTISASYLLAMIFLGLHLWHGGSSWLQTVGLGGDTPRRGWAHYVGPILAIVVVAGNCSMPLAVLLRLL